MTADWPGPVPSSQCSIQVDFDRVASELQFADFFSGVLPCVSFEHSLVDSCASPKRGSALPAGTTRRRTESSKKETSACSVWVVSNQMEGAMDKSFAAISGTFAILVAMMLVSGVAEAGASASAASKYGHPSQVAAVHQADRLTQRPHAGISEYSASARAPSHRHAYR